MHDDPAPAIHDGHLHWSLWAAIDRQIEEDDSVGQYDRDSDESMLDFLERELELKVRGSPAIQDIYVSALRQFRARAILRMAIIGPRGGGKTYLAAAIELVAFIFWGYDASNVGGSLHQAERAYGYVRDWYDRSELVRRSFSAAPTMSRSRSVEGRELIINASSETSVRGPHPGSDDHGGMLVVDEVAIMQDRIVLAALYQVSAANPSAVIQLSTMGASEGGYWSDLVEAEDHKGYELKSYTAFDVAARCPYDCAATCPVPEHFAADYYRGTGATRELVHKALCAGRAHETDGHLQVDEIAQSWRDTDSETFLREMMGVRGASIGKTFDSLCLEECMAEELLLSADAEQAQARFAMLEKVIGVDWGWAGQTAAVYLVRLRDTLVAYRWEMWDHVQYRRIRNHLITTAFAERCETIAPDAAEPSENAAMQEEADKLSVDPVEAGLRPSDEYDEFGVRVWPVVFSRWKRYGYGEVRRRLEGAKLVFPERFNGEPVPGYAAAMRYLREHRRQANGDPEKKNDHVSDALMCACIAFSAKFPRTVEAA